MCIIVVVVYKNAIARVQILNVFVLTHIDLLFFCQKEKYDHNFYFWAE